MRYESMADMPAKMREKAAPKLVEAERVKIQAISESGKVMMDNIWFDSRRMAQRYTTLLNMQQAGFIRDLHIRENVTIADAMILPGGEKRRQVRFQADFSYIPNMPAYYPPEIKTDETAWLEECAETCPEERVYELMHIINPEAREEARKRCLILREV